MKTIKSYKTARAKELKEENPDKAKELLETP